MDSACLAYGAIISVVVSVLKRIPLVNKYPKFTAALLSAAATFITASPLNSDAGVLHIVVTLLPCIGVQFATAVAFHETVVNPLTGDRTQSGT